MLLEVVGHRLTLVEHLLDAGVSDITRYNKRTLEVKTGLDGVLRQNLAHLVHTLVKVNLNSGRHSGSLCGEEASRILLQLLKEDTLRGNLCLDVTVCRAAYADSNGARGSVTRSADNANIVDIVLTAKLCAKANLLTNLLYLSLPLQVAEATATLVTRCGELVEVASRCLLNGRQAHLSRCTTDTYCEVVGRARRSAEVEDMLLDKLGQ